MEVSFTTSAGYSLSFAGDFKMTTPTDSPLFQEERAQTDDSLVLERGKTDQSLIGSQKKAERKSDEKVKNARQESDESRAQGRLDSDTKTLNKMNNRIMEERHDEDHNVERERTLVDAVIRDERTQKEALMNISLSKERAETDENLYRERLHVDLEVKREIVSHSETKIELTSRDEFLAIVSHDLRNPIGAIVSGSTHMLEDPSFQIDHEMKYWLEFIKRNAETSLRLISDLLDMERFAEGKLQIIKEPHNLNDLIRETIASFTHVASEKKIQLILKPTSNLRPVDCDRDRISQVLSNLIGNAIKFTPDEGSVTVGIEFINRETKISITDTGPGIAEDEKSKIFERFAQINNKDRRGLGLGLYISKMLIEAHAGKVGVKSTFGNGSTFFFVLPIGE